MDIVIDPYKVLELPKNITDAEVVKRNYKRLVFVYHPDSQLTGEDIRSSEKFKILTACYKKVMQELRMCSQDKSHQELRKEFMHAKPDQATSNNDQKKKGKFDSQEFNRIFDDHRVSTAYDDGYGSWMNKARCDGDKNRHALTKYKEPEPMHSSCDGFMELGLKHIKDFSGGNIGNDKVHYTDYRVAFTTDKIVDERYVAPRKEYRTVDELEKDRGTISYTMSAKEERRTVMAAERHKKKEKERLATLSQQDQRQSLAFEKARIQAMRLMG